MKKLILDALLLKLHSELELAKAALKSTKQLVNSDDMKSEGKYDTRGIEAGYLAGAQERRVKELQMDLASLKNINIEPKHEIAPGSLVYTKNKIYFVTSSSGGHKLVVEGHKINIVSMHAPIISRLQDEEDEQIVVLTIE